MLWSMAYLEELSRELESLIGAVILTLGHTALQGSNVKQRAHFLV
jgi:hypothetical protein